MAHPPPTRTATTIAIPTGAIITPVSTQSRSNISACNTDTYRQTRMDRPTTTVAAAPALTLRQAARSRGMADCGRGAGAFTAL